MTDTPDEIARKLTPTQRKALLWLPEGDARVYGPWPHGTTKPVKPESYELAQALWALQEEHRLPLADVVLVDRVNAHVEEWRNWLWALTAEGLAVRAALAQQEPQP
jgi:hypothetical protein